MTDHPQPERKPHRRDFVRALAWGASATALPASTPARAAETGAHGPAPATPEPRSEADARMELVLARFGKHLDADARKSVRAEIDAIVGRARALRAFPLENGDGPFPVFSPYRAPEGRED